MELNAMDYNKETTSEDIKIWEPSNMKVKFTTDYKMFRTMPENRIVKQARVAKIIMSFRKVGYIPIPIVVNERYEVIDGQGRLSACQQLGIPVSYMVIPGIGVEEMRELNRWLVKWVVGDDIRSYAASGMLPYIYLTQLIKEYRRFNLDIIYFAIHLKGTSSIEISAGKFECTEQQYNTARERLDFLNTIYDTVKRMPGSQNKMSRAVLYAYTVVDTDKLFKAIEKYWGCAKSFSTFEDALNELSYVINYRSRDEHISLTTMYANSVRGKGGKDLLEKQRREIVRKNKVEIMNKTLGLIDL